MQQVKFILRSKIPSLGQKNEYQYMLEITSNSGKKYNSHSVWHGYAETAREAKNNILLKISQTQSIDYILDDIILKDNNGNDYFVLVEENKNVHPIFKNMLSSL